MSEPVTSLPQPIDITPKTDGEAIRSGAIGGVSVALPAAAVLMLAKAYRQERRRMDMAKAKDSDTLVITLPEKRGSLLGDLGDKARTTVSELGDKAKALGSELVDSAKATWSKLRDNEAALRASAAASRASEAAAAGSAASATMRKLRDAKDAVGDIFSVDNAAMRKLRDAKDAVGDIFSVDNAGAALKSLIRSGFRGAGEVARTFASETSNAANLPAASRQALKYLAAVIAGGVTLRGADALYEAYNQRKLKRLEEASRKEYINRLFAKGAQATAPATEQDGQLVGSVMAFMALLAGTSAYGTKRVLDAMYPKTYTKVKAPVVRRIEFRSLPRDAQKADTAEEYEEFQDAKPSMKVAAVLEDGSEQELSWDVIRVLGLRHALLQDARDNGFRKFASHEAVRDWCAERFITVDHLREKLAQAAREATPQQQAEVYRMVDSVMKNPDMASKIDEISQAAVLAGRAATPLGRPSLLVSNAAATTRTRDAVAAQIRNTMADRLAGSFGMTMPRFQAASKGSLFSGSALEKNIESEVSKRKPELQSAAYRAAAGDKNLAAVLAKNVRETVAYKNMSPALKEVMDWLGSREAGSLPRMLYDWIIKRQVTSALSNAEENYANAQASVFANAPPASPAAAAVAATKAPKNQDGTLNLTGAAQAAVPPAAAPAAAAAPATGSAQAAPAAAPASTSVDNPASAPGDWATTSNWGAPAGAASSGSAADKAGAPTAAGSDVGKEAAPASGTTTQVVPRGASNVIDGEPFFDFLPKSKGFEHIASAGFSPSSLAEKLLTAPKKDSEETDEDEAAVRKLQPIKRRHIDVEATDPRAEEFVRRNKGRLVAALSNAVNSGDL